jgi:hypothetical protein
VCRLTVAGRDTGDTFGTSLGVEGRFTVATNQDDAALREELRLAEEELARVRRTANEIRAEIGGRRDGAVDSEDMAAAITSAEEQEALATSLQARRDRLRARLAAAEA